MKHLYLMTLFVVTITLTCTTPRHLFADGNVLAYLEQDDLGLSATLVILGDTDHNHIRVTLDDEAHVAITGLDGTTVNGLLSDELTSGNVPIASAQIDLGNGNDTLEHLCESSSILSTNIFTGNGRDSVSIAEFGATVSINVDTGVGDDSVLLYLGWSEISYTGSFQISTGVGQDSVTIEANNSDGNYPSYSEGNNNNIDTDEGDDTVLFEGYFDSLFTVVSMGAGDDLLIGAPEVFPPRVYAFGDQGHDTVLNDLYFWELCSFETIEN